MFVKARTDDGPHCIRDAHVHMSTYKEVCETRMCRRADVQTEYAHIRTEITDSRFMVKDERVTEMIINI
ncbi:hypothetical protein X798_02519 [Onchocerca flexuosa]|uniref:Uncharacterized protein n=2 Tax=Onchocerca flexuosa TaxID=387005 RepID=A0A183HB60_9BILA|nr:hypothetical protein X798_02519 [Onchocerca flexuosa]VDO40854.1 unnamed protein product [Onchocerca flexuosa]